MQDQNIATGNQDQEAATVVEQMTAEAEKAEQAEQAVPGMANDKDTLELVITKIREAENILVALSRDPSVDEMAGAIGLTMFLDGLQKHTTAIFSGKTPDALGFLRPEGTFETNTASLQDFIIALNREKADHLRYKLEGDFVKIYITPYKTTLSEADLEFSHGDYNVDLVLALSVPSAGDLDVALAEYGRIMHDATTIDITCGAPGRFGEIEWSEPGASSVSEMLTRLILRMQGEDAVLETGVANALLTGIVAATGRFSNERTNSETMQLASRLMEMGADQQMIAMHVIDSEKEEKEAEAAEKAAAEKAAAELKAAEEARAAKRAAETAKGVTVAVDEAAVEAAKARARMETAAEMAVNQAVQTAAENAAAVVGGVTGAGAPTEVVAPVGAGVVAPAGAGVPVGGEGPVLPPVMAAGAAGEVAPVAAPVSAPVAAPVAAPKNYEAMIEQALAEPLPVETAASAAGLLQNRTVPAASAAPVVPVTPVASVVSAAPTVPAASTPVAPVVPAAPTVPAASTPVAPVVPAAPTVPVALVAPAMSVPAVSLPTSNTPVNAADVALPVGMNPAVMAAPQEASEAAAPVLGAMTFTLPKTDGVATEMKPGQTVLPPAPAPEVGTGLMPPGEGMEVGSMSPEGGVGLMPQTGNDNLMG